MGNPCVTGLWIVNCRNHIFPFSRPPASTRFQMEMFQNQVQRVLNLSFLIVVRVVVGDFCRVDRHISINTVSITNLFLDCIICWYMLYMLHVRTEDQRSHERIIVYTYGKQYDAKSIIYYLKIIRSMIPLQYSVFCSHPDNSNRHTQDLCPFPQ